MFKEIVDDARQTPDIGRSQKLTMSTLCPGELKRDVGLQVVPENTQNQHTSNQYVGIGN